MELLEIVLIILLGLAAVNAILMNRISKLRDDLESMMVQTEVFLNDLSQRINSIERENDK